MATLLIILLASATALAQTIKLPISVEVPDYSSRLDAIESRLDALEAGVEPTPEPEPEPDPTPTPQPDPTEATGPSADHFNSVIQSPNLHVADSLNDPATYPDLIHGGESWIGDVVHYDPERNAARWDIPEGQISIPIGSSFRPRFPAITDDIVSIQWEALYDPRGFNGGKTFMASYTPEGDDRIHEIQSTILQSSNPDVPYYLFHSIRSYGFPAYVGPDGTASSEQLHTGDWANRNSQPALPAGFINTLKQSQPIDGSQHVGDGGGAYLVKPGIWVRYTLVWDLSVDPALLSFYVADEDTEPTALLLDYPYEPELASNHGLDGWWVELNNSSTKAPADLSVWVRNWSVYKGAAVPLGGRPAKGDGETELPIPEPEPEPVLPTFPDAIVALDFGDGAVAEGHEQVLNSDPRWAGTGRLNRDRGTSDPVLSDLVFIRSEEGTFSQPVPNGSYEVHVVIGDPEYMHRTGVEINGIDNGITETPVGEWAVISQQVSVTDGTVSVRLYEGKDPAIQALYIVPLEQ